MAASVTLAAGDQVRNLLSKWDDPEKPLAPLTERQLTLLDQLETLAGGTTGEKDENMSKEAVAETSTLQIEYANAREFISAFSRVVEPEMQREADRRYLCAVDVFRSYRAECGDLKNDVQKALDQLGLLQTDYKFVTEKTGALHCECESLLSEQSKLAGVSEAIQAKLRHFVELEALQRKLHAPSLTVLSDGFIPLLTRIDECLGFLENHPEYKESTAYVIRYRHLQSSALGMVKAYVSSTLEQSARQVQAASQRSTQANPELDTFTLLYVKFKSHAPRIKSLTAQIEERMAPSNLYSDILEEVHSSYFTQRNLLLAQSLDQAIQDLKDKHPKDHCSFLRQSASLLARLCHDETQLYYQFFSKSNSALDDFLSSLCAKLYDAIRPMIVHVLHLETLSELCSILKQEESATDVRAFQECLHAMLQDVQERLVFRTLVYIRTDILGYNAAPGDLAYPEKLEMMQTIAETLAGAPPLSRSSSRASIASESAVSSAGEVKRRLSSVSGASASPADIHGMWYPTVRRTLLCLSKLYRCLDKSIFQGLSQEVLAMCIESLVLAADSISKRNKTPLHGRLFEIKHLLILREQIAPFQIDFAIKETSLDFTRIRDAALSLMNNKNRLFSLGTNNALLEFLFEGTPQVKESLIDSKKAVDKQLKFVCERFIEEATSHLVGGELRSFLDRCLLITAQSDPNIQLKKQPFAEATAASKVVSASYRDFKERLARLQKAMSLYLANRDTEAILFKPIKNKTVAFYEKLNKVIEDEYSQDDMKIIACPSAEQISMLMSQL
ncbi:conserved oligomeric Golgi complex subunit 3-like [Tropilaelaps mercedesae]|uniref:Conserved oligomeric Golgi complex subunit 3 n=1 Tax=Tropilaelaps mercedesae TaxID=418985 RepID=A0A1V9XQU6_9ACAR|nr:conserved oligomeric Golgi complex subunit 3-like [Tropilaelaps mercedesae]